MYEGHSGEPMSSWASSTEALSKAAFIPSPDLGSIGFPRYASKRYPELELELALSNTTDNLDNSTTSTTSHKINSIFLTLK